MSEVSQNYSHIFVETFEASREVKSRLAESEFAVLNEIANQCLRSLRGGNKIILFGNGGSAADSQHIAAELVSKFTQNRKALRAIALTTDTSILTSVANDFAFEEVFARQVEALGNAGDTALAISTSGQSANIIKAVRMAKEMGLATVGFTGKNGGKLVEYVDLCFRVPSQNTARIQEVHITAAHALCDILEKELG
ncbi:MAG: SIS domain-containing protein [bacterium]